MDRSPNVAKHFDVRERPSRDRFLSVDDAYKLPVLRTLLLELDVPVFLREQCMVAPDSHINASVKTRATLPHDNVARGYLLATIDFDP